MSIYVMLILKDQSGVCSLGFISLVAVKTATEVEVRAIHPQIGKLDNSANLSAK